jgi:D-alanyl-D-alanine carboxypeptidase (penicillin-binding protein 5/6)
MSFVRRSLAGHDFRSRIRGFAGLLLLAAGLAVPLAGLAFAANQSVQGAPKKEEGGFQTDAPTAILIDAESGSVLFEKEADRLAPPSSMMKMMTVEYVFNELTQGRIRQTDEFVVSENAWRRGGAPSGGSTMFAAIHSRVPVKDLLYGAIVQSGNDSCIILAEALAGNERAFAAKLTERARALGLPRSTFGNSNGLPDPANLMTARELAMLARHIVRTYPDLYKIFGEREFTWNKIRQFNRNPLLTMMEGADGFKTGMTKDGGYGMVGSAVRGGMRLIVVVNGMEDPDDRASEAKKLLEWGFRNFESRPLFAANRTIGYAKVFGGDAGSVAVFSPKPVGVMIQKNGNDKIVARIVYTGPLRAPIAPGRAVGMLRVWRNNNVALETPIYTNDNVGTGSLARRAFDGASEFVIGLVQRNLKL